MNETGSIDGMQYRLVRKGTRWRAAYWCDCILGPHWHDIGTYKSKEEARTLLKKQSQYTSYVDWEWYDR